MTDIPNRFKGPTMRYGPNGESAVFKHHADVPEGWEDDPAKHLPPDPNAPKEPDPNALPLTKAEICAALDAWEISYAKNAGARKLYDLLVTSLQAALTARGVAFSPTAAAPALLAMVAG